MVLVWVAKGTSGLSFIAITELFAAGSWGVAVAAFPVVAGSAYAARRFAQWRARGSATG